MPVSSENRRKKTFIHLSLNDHLPSKCHMHIKDLGCTQHVFLILLILLCLTDPTCFVSFMNMKKFSVFFSLCTIVTLSHAYPYNSTHPPSTHPPSTYLMGTGEAKGICKYKMEHCTGLIGEFCPQCDANGNFLPQQCRASTGHCWCVDIISGEEIPNTDTPPGVMPVNCGE